MKKNIRKLISLFLISSILFTSFVFTVNAQEADLAEEGVDAEIASSGAVSISADRVVSYFKGRVGQAYDNGYCLRFVADSWKELGAVRSSACCAYNYGNSHIMSTSINNVPIGADVFFGQSSSTCSSCKSNAGHIGVYVGAGEFVHANSGKIQISSLSSWSKRYRGWGYHTGVVIPDIVIPTDLPLPDNNHDAFGHSDGTQGGKGNVQMFGYTFDPDTSAPNNVHAYLRAPAGDPNAVFLGGFTANTLDRPDVAQAYPQCQGTRHGYHVELPVPSSIVGTLDLYLYSINVDGTPGNNTMFSKTTVTIQPQDPPANGITQIPNDFCCSTVDKVWVSDYNKVHIVGWSFCKASPNTSSFVDVYVDGEIGTGKAIQGFRTLANVTRTDVEKSFKGEFPNVGSAHGFEAEFTIEKPGNHTLYFYSVNERSAVNPQIATAVNIITTSPPVKPTAAPTQTPTQAPTQVTDETSKPSLSLSNAEVLPDDTFSIALSLDKNSGITAMSVQIDYPDVFTLVDIEYKDLFSSKASGGKKTANPYILSWYSTACEDEHENGVLAVLTFKVNDNAELGDYSIKLRYDSDNIFNENMDNVTFTTTDASVKIQDHIPGDVNQDRAVNMKDVVMAQKYVNGETEGINGRFVDVDGDRKTTMRDVILILKKHNGEDVTLK